MGVDGMTETECPTCGAAMENKGVSRDVRHRGGVVGVDISVHECPECGTIVDDDGIAHTKADQMHEVAWREYAYAIDDWSVIPDHV